MPFKMKEQQRHIKGLIAETLTLLCKSGLSFKENCKIEALIGITLDDDDVFLVNIKQRLGDKGNAVSNYTSSELEDNEVADSGGESGGPSKKHKKNRKRKRKRSSSQRTTDGPDSARKQRKADHGETDSMDEFDGDDYGTMENNDSETIGSVLHSSGEPNIACVKTEPEETHEGIVIVKQEQPSPTHERSTDDTYGQLDSVVANQTNDVTASDNDGQLMTDGITGEATNTATKKTSKATKIQPQPNWTQRYLRKRKVKPNKKFTDGDDIENAALAVVDGKELHTVASQFGVNAKDVLQLIREKGWKKNKNYKISWTKKPLLSNDMQKAFKDVKENGYTVHEAAKKYGLPASTIKMNVDSSNCRSDFTDEELVCAVIATLRNEMGFKKASITYGIDRNYVRNVSNQFIKHSSFESIIQSEGNVSKDDDLSVISEETKQKAIERVNKWRWEEAERKRRGFISYLEDHCMNLSYLNKLVALATTDVDYTEKTMLKAMRDVMKRDASTEDACIKFNVPLPALEYRVSHFNWRERHYLDETNPTKLNNRNKYFVCIPKEAKNVDFKTVDEFNAFLADFQEQKANNPKKRVTQPASKAAKKSTDMKNDANTLPNLSNMKFVKAPDGTLSTSGPLLPNAICIPPGTLSGNVMQVNAGSIPANAIPVPIMLSSTQVVSGPVQVPKAPLNETPMVSLIKAPVVKQQQNAPVIFKAVSTSQQKLATNLAIVTDSSASGIVSNSLQNPANTIPPKPEIGSFVDVETLKQSFMKPTVKAMSTVNTISTTPSVSVKKNTLPSKLAFMPNYDQFKEISNVKNDSPVLINMNGSLYLLKNKSSELESPVPMAMNFDAQMLNNTTPASMRLGSLDKNTSNNQPSQNDTENNNGKNDENVISLDIDNEGC